MTTLDLVGIAKRIAVELATLNREVHIRDVRAAMLQRGHLTELADGVIPEGEYWLGSVFRGGRFEWTGKYHSYSDRKRNIHERTVKVWRLASAKPPKPNYFHES